MATTAFATTAPGFFSGTAPHHYYGDNQNNDQGKQLLPFHAANITAKPIRATGFFDDIIIINCHPENKIKPYK
jgi:hypothetical protein